MSAVLHPPGEPREETFAKGGGANALLSGGDEQSEPESLISSLPLVSMSQQHGEVRAALSEAGFACVEQSGSDGTRFACIDDIPSGQRAAELAAVAFAAMGLGMDARFTIHQEGPVSLNEWKSHAADWERFARKQDG